MSKTVSSDIHLFRKSFEEALEHQESERKKLNARQESVTKGLEYIEKRLEDFETKEAELQELQLVQENGFKELDLKRKELGENMENFRVREQKLRDKEIAIEVEREKLQEDLMKSRRNEEALQRRRAELHELGRMLLTSLETDELQVMESVLASRKKQRALGENILELMSQDLYGSSNLQDDGERESEKRKMGAFEGRESQDIITKKRGRTESEEMEQGANFSKTNGDGSAMASNNEFSRSDSAIFCHPSPQISKFPAPQVYEFVKRKECFAASEFWACYDGLDGMPRTYIKIWQVYVRGSKLRVSELEIDPTYEKNHGFHKGLPSGCGKFVSHPSTIITNAGKFSHKIVSGIHKVGGAYLIYPSNGQIWALFKDWDTRNTASRDPKKFSYEIVEVLSDFVESTGIRVAYLKKIVGYVGLFHRAKDDFSFMIRPEHMYRFSHQIPSQKMKGSEREGIPEGSLVLDPAALPTHL